MCRSVDSAGAWRKLAVAAALLAACARPAPVDELVAAHVQARGGEARLHALRSMRASGVADAGGGRVGRIVREVARPGRIRLELTYQGVTAVYAHDGERGWEIAPLRGSFTPQPLAAESAAAAVDQLDVEGPLVGWREKGHQVRLLGRETVAGRPADKLELRLRGGALRYDYLDAETHLLVRTDVARTIRGRQVWLETTFADYREVEGLRFPFAIETRAAGRPQRLRIEVESIDLDPPLDEARFRPPA